MTTPLLDGDPITLTAEAGAPYVAVDIRPDDAGGAFVVDDDELDGDSLLAWGDGTDGWVNIVCDVMAISTRRGATRLQGVQTRAEAGNASLNLEDPARRFDPLINADVIHRNTPVRVRGWGFADDGAGDRWDVTVFTGRVDDLSVTYPTEAGLPPQVFISVTDVVGPLVNWKAAGYAEPGVGAGDNLLERVERINAELGDVFTLSPDSDPAYAVTLAATTLASDAWTDINDAAEAELGRVWVDVENRVVVRARGSELAGPVRGTLSDVHGEAPLGVHCCYSDPTVVFGGEQMSNRVLAARRIPAGVNADQVLVIANDTASQARYGVSTLERRALELERDDQVRSWAQAVISQDGRPDLRVDSVQPAPWNNPEAWPAVLATDVGDRWLYRQQLSAGAPVSLALGVLGIEHTITPDAWRVVFHTTAAPEPGVDNPTGLFLLDVSELDGEDVLAPPIAVQEQQPDPAPVRIIDGGAP